MKKSQIEKIKLSRCNHERVHIGTIYGGIIIISLAIYHLFSWEYDLPVNKRNWIRVYLASIASIAGVSTVGKKFVKCFEEEENNN